MYEEEQNDYGWYRPVLVIVILSLDPSIWVPYYETGKPYYYGY